MYKFLLFLILFVSINSIQAQNRLKRPIQLQGNFSGALLSVTANSLADETVDDVKVNKWRPGIDIGYHVNRFVYLGYSFSSSLNLTLKEEWGFTNAAQDGNIVLDHKTGLMHSIETRISPFKFGLYVSLAYMTNLFLKSSKPSRFSRIKPYLRISLGLSKFSFKSGLNSATKSGLLSGSVAIKLASMVKLFSFG